MDRFLMMDNQLIKVEVEEKLNFHCIVCKAEFLSRSERNDHLETHFIHRSCTHCSRPVIVIGDLEFELHQPTYCKQFEVVIEDVFEGGHSLDEENTPEDYIQYEDEASDQETTRKTKRNKNVTNYDEDTSELEGQPDVKKDKPARRAKQKTKRPTKKNKVDTEPEPEPEPNLNDDYIDNTYLEANGEIEDDVVKEMDVVAKKRRKHYRKLPKTVPCTAENCDAMFGTERTLKIHMNQVHGIKERYICPICSREFKIGGNLKQHIETHSDYKRFICNYCGKGFHLPYNLKEHMNTHTGARPYECKTCGKTFGRNTLRQAHMRIHTGEKPYKCSAENCDRAYAYQTDLKRHRRSVHGVITKTFPCPICSKVFYENKFLTKHLNVHQGNA